MTETMRFGIADELINEALVWADIPLRVETVNGEQVVIDPPSHEETIGLLLTVVVVQYIRFQGHADAKAIMEEAARLVMGERKDADG